MDENFYFSFHPQVLNFNFNFESLEKIRNGLEGGCERAWGIFFVVGSINDGKNSGFL